MRTRRTALSGAFLLAVSVGVCVAISSCSKSDNSTSAASSDESSHGTNTSEVGTVRPESSQPSIAPESIPTTCAGTLAISDTQAIRGAAARTLAVGVSGFDDAAAAVEAGVRHLFIGSGTDRSLLNGQGDASRSLAELQRRAAAADAQGAHTETPITVSVDEEGGRVQRLTDLTGSLPSAREAAATMSTAEVSAMFTEHAQKMRALGITMDFAPDVDLDSGDDASDNAIGDRAYSADPAVVVNYGRAAIEGLLASGITPVIKHFPGHGHATGDSHTGTVSTPPLDQMGADLRPFAELSQIPGVAVMVGHVQVPGLDAPGVDAPGVVGADTPASLNPASYILLRDGIDHAPGFNGQIFTDDLTGMRAVTDRWEAGSAVVTALSAGADAPLVSSGMDAAALPGVLDAVVSAVSAGTLTVGRLGEAVDRTCAATAVSDPVTD